MRMLPARAYGYRRTPILTGDGCEMAGPRPRICWATLGTVLGPELGFGQGLQVRGLPVRRAGIEL